MKPNSPDLDYLKSRLAAAWEETYRRQDQEADKDPEARRLLVQELNQQAQALGLQPQQFSPHHLDQPGHLAQQLREAPGLDLYLRQSPERARQWASQEPPLDSPDRPLWLAKAEGLLQRSQIGSTST